MVHPPEVVPNPELHSVTIEPGKAYRFKVEKRTTKLLPTPYQTNCLDYTTLNREKRTNATMTQENCIDECYIETILDTCGCTKARLAITYGLNVTICCGNKSLSSCLRTNQKKLEDICQARCRLPCKKDFFIVDNGDSYIWPQVQEDMDDELNYSTLDDARKNIAWVRVFYGTTEQKVYIHRPRLEAIEIFSLVGGYLGLWLGMSLFDLPRIGKYLVKLFQSQVAFHSKSSLSRHQRRVRLNKGKYNFEYIQIEKLMVRRNATKDKIL
ncbi:degenerin mec-10-like [Limulus polyphemus]|uniref:Degenerin mec-10-like n=1 Tax=Limulus polyphemus TaxID=6850 RepID=A0ABM1SB36_LIMPO|nr:degenerin mec-10-like [Limulus polyphemus]